MGLRHWFLHNVRSALGTAQTLTKVTDLEPRIHGYAEKTGMLQSRIAVLESRVEQLETLLKSASLPVSVEHPPAGVTACRLNDDPINIPDELLKFVIHTRVNSADDPVPKLLAETEHYIWCRERLMPGDTALDVGSNIGLFSTMFAKMVKYGLVGTVHAIEASPTVFRDLQLLVKANNLDNVVVTHAAAADKPGTLTFIDLQTDSVSRESSHLLTEGRDAADTPGRVDVPAITLDGYSEYHRGLRPRLIKIDVEGAEFLVLEGARKMIGEHRPFLCIEIHPDERGIFEHARLKAYLDSFGYTYRHRDKTYYCE